MIHLLPPFWAPCQQEKLARLLLTNVRFALSRYTGGELSLGHVDFRDVGWVYNVSLVTAGTVAQSSASYLQIVHRPTFLAESQELWSCIANGNTASIDPAWLALYYMVLCGAVSSKDSQRVRSETLHKTTAEIDELPARFRAVAHRALRAADWVGVPQVRCLQVSQNS